MKRLILLISVAATPIHAEDALKTPDKFVMELTSQDRAFWASMEIRMNQCAADASLVQNVRGCTLLRDQLMIFAARVQQAKPVE